MREDRVVGYMFVGAMGIAVLVLVFGVFDAVQSFRAESRTIECARSGMASVRRSFSTEVVCIPYVVVAPRGR